MLLLSSKGPPPQLLLLLLLMPGEQQLTPQLTSLVSNPNTGFSNGRPRHWRANSDHGFGNLLNR